MDKLIRWRSLANEKWQNEMPCELKVFLTGDKRLYVKKEFVESYVYRQMSLSYASCSRFDINYDEFIQIFNKKNYLFFKLFKKLFYNEYVSYYLYGDDMTKLMKRLLIPIES